MLIVRLMVVNVLLSRLNSIKDLILRFFATTYPKSGKCIPVKCHSFGWSIPLTQKTASCW